MQVPTLSRPVIATAGLLGRLERLEREVASLLGLGPAPEPDRGPEMRCEEFSRDGAVVVRAELPGLDPGRDVEVTIADGVLRLRARRRPEPGEGRSGTRSEFFYGEMVRTLALPPGARADAVTATYADGVLEVVVPVDGGPTPAVTVPVVRSA